MSERLCVLATACLAGLGTAVTGYLTYVHYADARIACPTSGCEAVQSSSYADVFGVPVGLLGLVAYLAVLVALLAPSELSRWLVLGIALAGLIFSAYLVSLEAFRIEAFCIWCLASDAFVTLIAALAFLRVRAAKRLADSAGVTASARRESSRWSVIALAIAPWYVRPDGFRGAEEEAERRVGQRPLPAHHGDDRRPAGPRRRGA